MCVPDSKATIRNATPSAQAGISAEERIRRKREENAPSLDATPTPDMADFAATQGDALAVRRARGSSMAKAFGRFNPRMPTSVTNPAASIFGGP